MRFALDRAPSARSIDDNGFLHVKNSHITKATVNPYYGREIPGWREAGLDPEKIYYGLRDPRELQKSIGTWEGLPLHIEHHPDSADEPEIKTRVGAVGKAYWANPYVDASLTVWNQQAIDAIEDGSFRELSCAYRYTPDFTPGKYEGVDYDFVMRNIRGNHVALVEEGRAGADVLVADAALDGKEDQEWRTSDNGKKFEIDTKTGEITKGNLGQKKSLVRAEPTKIESTAPDMARYKALLEQHEGNFQKAAHEYFKEKLQGKYVEARTKEGIIKPEFTGGTWQEVKRGLNKDSTKAELVPYMADILSTGEHKEQDPHKERKDNASQFHYYKKVVETSEGPKSAIVDVIVRPTAQPEVSVYSITHEGSKGYQTKIEKMGKDKAVSAMSSGSSLITRNNGLNENIIPQYEVVNIRFADETLANITKDAKPKTIGGGIMRKFKKWFKGAKDANPDIERAEVDLAQSILDLHKVDPNTGEIVDITEDEDKAEEIRKIVGEISGKLEPEELKKLNDALAGLAYSKATGDEEPKKEGGMDEEMKSAICHWENFIKENVVI